MKKVIIFGSAIVILFIAIALLTNASQTQKIEGNPYGKDDLDTATIDILDDPNYQNLILPEELEEQLENGEEVTVYFFSPQCEFCLEATPRLVEVADEVNVDIKQYNLLEFEQGWNDYNIRSTPTLIHFENGEEVDRLLGAAPNEEFEAFLSANTN